MQSEILNRRFFSRLRQRSANCSVHRKFFSQNKGDPMKPLCLIIEVLVAATTSCCSLSTLIRHIQRQIRPTFQRRLFKTVYSSSNPNPSTSQSRLWELSCRSRKIAATCGLFAPIKSLCIPSSENYGEFSSPVSALDLRYTQILSGQLRDQFEFNPVGHPK